MDIKSLIIPFLSGGVLVATIKFLTSVIQNTEIAAIVGAFPIGLFSIYFLTDQKAHSYGFNYSQTIIVLLLASLVFNALYNYLGYSKNISYILAIVSWFVLVLIKIIISYLYRKISQ